MDTKRRTEMLERYERATELPVLLLALAIIPLLGIPLVIDLSSSVETAFFATDLMIWAVFALDLGIRTFLADRRLRYLIHHWFDVLIVVLPFLRPLRVVRSARALRLARLAPFFIRIASDLYRLGRRNGLQYVVLGGLLAVLICASVVYAFERNEGGGIDDFGTALWWAASTMTTVGYGDAVPVTAEGRGVAVVLMVIGISSFSWLTASIAAFFVEFGGKSETPVTMGDLMAKLESLEAELKALRKSSGGRAATR